MSNSSDNRVQKATAHDVPINELTGQPDNRTGEQLHDPKDVHQDHYTTTPIDDRVGSADQGKYKPTYLDNSQVTQQFDPLATRDPAAMELELQGPDRPNAERKTGSTALSLEPRTAIDVAVNASTALAASQKDKEANHDSIPGYTPPSIKKPPKADT